MLSSLLRPKRNRQRVQDDSPFSSPFVAQSSPAEARQGRRAARHASADFTVTEEEDERTEDERTEEEDEDEDENENEEDEEALNEDNEDGDEDTPLLPIFSAVHLDSLPVYNLTHAIRLIILPRTETTLTWDQLRSPQVSSFLVKPMQQQIRTSHFNRATLYALMANCLQFQKEGQANPGNAGNSKTRAMVCELLAVKLLKEYNTRELIDALSYDFFPLQGLVPDGASGQGEHRNRPRPGAARTSTLEVAIRASAKKFLAHPVVVQHLEAIWAGTIVFHSASDNLHRRHITPSQEQAKPPENRHLLVPSQNQGYGGTSQLSPRRQQILQHSQSRRTATLYDPRDASLFKLSRLRVPRYRQFFSTCSLAILLGLFVAVLKERSSDITTLEVVFWFWSAGFMLDEVVGFNEQGFSLYIMSFWNTFDLGILLLLILYYCMRLYGIVLVDVGRHDWNSMAYDVLATNAVLLFPRLFSVLDHYRYFSQLLIAFRLMAIDLVAVFILILIACSGFFVAFTLSFGQGEYDAAGVAFKIFQMIMGFTPAAWEAWETYNALGKAILVLFLFICHFLVVTILITVLTNSFMAIVSNANDEHQFVFAVNTISMVKNDALFSYVAPTNIFAWFFTPLRFCLPFRTFIKANRTAIKVSHFPLLFGIYGYERFVLARSVFEPTDLVEQAGQSRRRLISFQDKSRLFSPRINRQDSVAGFQKDTALDEVFRLAPAADTIRTVRKDQSHSVVNNWMDHQGGAASPPQEQDRSVVDRLEQRRQARQATMRRKRAISGNRSVASDPADFMSTGAFHEQGYDLPSINFEQNDDGDGDDELVTNEDPDEGMTLDRRTARSQNPFSDKEAESEEEDYFQTPGTTKIVSPRLPMFAENPRKSSLPKTSPPRKTTHHHRNISTATILYNPVLTNESSASSPPKSRPTTAKRTSRPPTASNTPIVSGSRTPRNSIYAATNTKAKPRPILPPRQDFQSMPNFNLDSRLTANNAARPRQIRHRRSSLDMGMSDMAFEGNTPGMNMLGAVPSSFATQLAMATGGLKAFGGRGENKAEDTDRMMGRLMLARMKTLEEGFAEVVREFREMRTAGNSSVEGSVAAGLASGLGVGKENRKGKGKEREREKSGMQVRKKRFEPVELVDGTSEFDFVDGERLNPSEAAAVRRYISKGSSF